MKQFLAVRNAAALPKKLANSLSEAEHQLATISEVRQQMDQRATNWEALLVYYERVIRVLMGTRLTVGVVGVIVCAGLEEP